MYYPYYKDASKFVPDSKSIQLWQKTRKNNSDNKPGIFETTDFTKDQLWSIASILIELSALYFTFQGAYKSYLQTGNIWVVWIALIAVFLFIAFDLIGIMLHGHDKSQRTITKSHYLVEKDDNVRLKLYNQLKEITMREFFGLLLLSISALLKIAALWYFFQLSNVQLLVVFTLLYLIVIYIHSVHTVYWWPALKLKMSIKKQYRNWKILHDKSLPTPQNNTINSNNVIRFQFYSSLGLDYIISTCEDDRIKVIPTGSGNFTLEVTGPLWDENIVHLCSQWGDIAQQDLLHSCIKVQLMQCGVLVN
jgi:hypothetical protein